MRSERGYLMKKMSIRYLLTGAANAALLVAGASFVPQAFAAGFQVTTHSAEGLGRAYAGEGAVTDSASSVIKNPAAALEVGKTAISVSAVHTFADVNVEDISFAANGAPAPEAIIGDGDDITDSATSPGLVVVHKPNQHVAVALSAKSDFSSNTDYGTSTRLGKVEVKTVNLGATVALKVTPKFNVGITGQYVKADAEINNSNGKLEGKDENVAYTLGTLYKAAPGHQYAVIYRSKQDLDLVSPDPVTVPTGLPAPFPATIQTSAELPVELPETLSFSGTNQITPKTSVQYSVDLTRWSRIQNLTLVTPVGSSVIADQSRDNSRRIAVGATHQLNPKMKIRGGVAYDTSSYGRDQSSRFSSPDENRIWLTGGLTYQTSNAGTVDAGLGYVHIEDDNEVTDNAAAPQLVGKPDAKGILLGVQYNHKFK